MATLRVVDHNLVLELSWLEKLGALRGDLRVPLTHVRTVTRVERPLSEVRGLRVPGTSVPGLLALGVYRRSSGSDVVAAYRHPGLVVELEGERYSRIVASTPDVDGVLEAIRSAA